MLKKNLIATLATLLFGFLYFYFELPAINWRSIGLWWMLFLMAVIYVVVYFWTQIAIFKNPKTTVRSTGKQIKLDFAFPKNFKIALGVLAAILVLAIAICFFSSSVIFNASAYQQMLTVKESDFSEDIAQMPLSQIPIVDKDTAQRLANRKIGEVVELVSQFALSNYNTQINYQEKPYRVLPLEYADFIKWMFNRDSGIPYYVTVDMATQNADLVELSEGMRYSPSEYFSRDLMRHVRFHYPTKMIDEISFEINDAGEPYWVLPYYTYTIGIVGGKDIAGIILCNAVTGELTDYPVSDIPQWIDRAYSSTLVVEQANNWGTLVNGWFNSVFAQKNVVITTDGYNYIAVNDDVWLYTGITSVVSDESNIGFILINLRTKEAKTYAINGAEEYSAMTSAQGAVQEKNYTATFPILINVEDVPTYFISLKDNAGLVKMYSFVAVSNYQTVGVSDTLAGAMDDYIRMLKANGIIGETTIDPPVLTQTVIDKVDAVASAVVNGNSTYFIKIGENVYRADVSVNPALLPFLKEGETVTIIASKEKQNGVYEVKEILYSPMIPTT